MRKELCRFRLGVLIRFGGERSEDIFENVFRFKISCMFCIGVEKLLEK